MPFPTSVDLGGARRNRTKSSMPECGVGSPYGSDTKPEWMKTGSWNTAVLAGSCARGVATFAMFMNP